MSKKTPELKSLFSTIATCYDRLNAILSLGRHRVWTEQFLNLLGPTSHLLDLCAGTGQISLNFLKRYPGSQATLLDFCPEMLAIAKKKGKDLSHRLHIVEGDAHFLPFKDSSFDVISMSYGLRNLQNPTKSLQEIHRVLTPKGRLGILELTKPHLSKAARYLHKIALSTYVPIIGKLFSTNSQAYQYLGTSIQELPEVKELSLFLENNSFKVNSVTYLTYGTATIWICEKVC